MNKVIENVDYNMDKYEFGEAARTLYSFVWDDFASWYVEISKVDLSSDDKDNIQMTKNVLVYVLRSIVKLLHPFIPFITEEIYQVLPHTEESISIYAKDSSVKNIISNTVNYLTKFTNPKNLVFLDNDIEAKDYSVTVLSMAKIYIPTSDLVDKEEVIKKLLASKAKLEGELERSKKMLSNESFISKAPQAKIDAEKAKQAEYKAQYDEVLKSLKELGVC